MSAERDVLSRDRLARAHETLVEAEALAAIGRWNGCLNRLYYACFYAVTALLLQQGYSSSKHTGVRGLFNQHVVHTGLVDAEFGSFYNNLFDDRLRGDYRDLAHFREDQVQPLIGEARRFVARMQHLVEQHEGRLQ